MAVSSTWCCRPFCSSKTSCLLSSFILCLISAIAIQLLLDALILPEDEKMGHEQDDSQVFLGVDSVIMNLSLSEMRQRAVYMERENVTDYPIIVWWTPFTGHSRIIHSCSNGSSCLFTHSRTEFDNPLTKAFMFYGTQIDWTTLPLPRQGDHMWVLFHEESSKNNWHLVYESAISLFNITATSSRYSTYPLVTQYLSSIGRLLRPLKYPTEEKSKGDIGLVMYLHSDCDPPSDRDSYVSELMKYVKVDSYGKCLHNKDLPEHLREPLSGMISEELLDIIGQYKFTLAMENAVCNDYITEKFWRPLYAGSVPIVKGSPTIKDWAPNDHSIILIDDYSSPKELADYLLYLDKHDDEYEKYLSYKATGVTNTRLLDIMKNREWSIEIDSPFDKNMIESYECFVCDLIHERLSNEAKGIQLEPLIANTSHYDCQFPVPALKVISAHSKEETEFWRQVAKRAEYQADAIGPAIKAGKSQKVVSEHFESAQKKMKYEDWSLPPN